jgi:hypothetical protein
LWEFTIAPRLSSNTPKVLDVAQAGNSDYVDIPDVWFVTALQALQRLSGLMQPNRASFWVSTLLNAIHVTSSKRFGLGLGKSCRMFNHTRNGWKFRRDAKSDPLSATVTVCSGETMKLLRWPANVVMVVRPATACHVTMGWKGEMHCILHTYCTLHTSPCLH